MRLSEQALEAITRETRLKLAIALGFSEVWITKSIEKNKSNGPLTTASALQIIREETGLTDDQILESQNAQVG